MLDQIRRLFAHLAWADAHVLESIREAGNPPRARELLAHILGAELTWLARIEGRTSDVPVWPELSLYQCGVHLGRVREAYERFLGSIGEDDLATSVRYVNSAGNAFDSEVGDILLQVALHGTYHRGQIALLVRDGGATPRPTDYIGFVRGAPAATRMDGADLK
jgi:uncharacterized damage-inducible protein DinB